MYFFFQIITGSSNVHDCQMVPMDIPDKVGVMMSSIPLDTSLQCPDGLKLLTIASVDEGPKIKDAIRNVGVSSFWNKFDYLEVRI